MVAGVNRFHGIGNLTGDPKLSQGDDRDGKNDRCEFSIAINRPAYGNGPEPEPTYASAHAPANPADSSTT